VFRSKLFLKEKTKINWHFSSGTEVVFVSNDNDEANNEDRVKSP
jgi:hypothetical protein